MQGKLRAFSKLVWSSPLPLVAAFSASITPRSFLARSGFGVFPSALFGIALMLLPVLLETAQAGIARRGAKRHASVQARTTVQTPPKNSAETSLDLATLGRAHNDANVIALGGRFTAPEFAFELVNTFLTTPFSGDERHVRRIGQVSAYEQAHRA